MPNKHLLGVARARLLKGTRPRPSAVRYTLTLTGTDFIGVHK